MKAYSETRQNRTKHNRLVLIYTTLTWLLIFSACTPLNSALKASPAPDSGFLPHHERLSEQRERYPFHRVWSSKSFEAPSRYKKISFAEVDTEHAQRLSLWREANNLFEDGKADLQEMAHYTRERFIKTINNDPKRQFTVVDDKHIDANTLLVEIAIVELTPSSVAQSIAGTAAGLIVPGGGLLSAGSSGAIAIEVKVSDSITKEVVFMFADREKGKLAPINLRDFSLYAHARQAVDDWAKQWLQITTEPAGLQVADSSAITLLPW